MHPKLKINGVDLTSQWKAANSSVREVLTHRIDTASLLLDDKVGTLGLTGKDEVILSNDAQTIRYFGGYIATIVPTVKALTRYYKVECQDYTILLDSVIINEIYEDMTDKEIIQAAFTKYLPEITTATYIQEGEYLDRQPCPRWTLRELLDYLSKLSGFDWRIDYWKGLHYFAKETNSAPFGLSDSPDLSTTYPYDLKSYRKDACKIINRVWVEGGRYLSDDQDWDDYPANGEQENIQLDYKLWPKDGADVIEVAINTGTDVSPSWVTKTVGVDNVNNLTTHNVLHNREEKLLRFAPGHKPSQLKKAIKVGGRYMAKVIQISQSDSSYAKYSRWFDGKINDPGIQSLSVAELRAKAVLAESAFEIEKGKAICKQDGLSSGMYIPITDGLLGINDNYLIRSITTTFKGNQVAEYAISFGEYNPDLVDILLDTKRGSFVEQTDDEALNTLIPVIEPDKLELEDDMTVSSHMTESYKWGSFQWGYATWK